MDESARLHLQNMIKTNNVTDQTELIRQLKHSEVLRENVQRLVMLKSKHKNNPDQLNIDAMTECYFLFNYYTDIYNKIKKDEIDLGILFQFFDVLEKIEKNELDQHEGSFEVGSLLKKIYIDSALKKAEKLNIEDPQPEMNKGIDVTWKQFKNSKKV